MAELLAVSAREKQKKSHSHYCIKVANCSTVKRACQSIVISLIFQLISRALDSATILFLALHLLILKRGRKKKLHKSKSEKCFVNLLLSLSTRLSTKFGSLRNGEREEKQDTTKPVFSSVWWSWPKSCQTKKKQQRAHIRNSKCWINRDTQKSDRVRFSSARRALCLPSWIFMRQYYHFSPLNATAPNKASSTAIFSAAQSY